MLLLKQLWHSKYGTQQRELICSLGMPIRRLKSPLQVLNLQVFNYIYHAILLKWLSTVQDSKTARHLINRKCLFQHRFVNFVFITLH